MNQPLALLFQQKPLSGNQLATKLEGLGYRIQRLADAEELEPRAKEGAMLILAEVENASDGLLHCLTALKSSPATGHIPIIVFASKRPELDAGFGVGSLLAVETSALLEHLEAFLEQALRLE